MDLNVFFTLNVASYIHILGIWGSFTYWTFQLSPPLGECMCIRLLFHMLMSKLLIFVIV